MRDIWACQESLFDISREESYKIRSDFGFERIISSLMMPVAGHVRPADPIRGIRLAD